MKTLRDSSWPAEAPPPDFARRTAVLLLRDRALGRGDALELPVARRRRWPVVLLAAITASATAWGTFALRQEPHRPAETTAPAEDSAEQAAPASSNDVRAEGTVQLPSEVEAPPARAPHRPAPAPRSKPVAAPEPEVVPPPPRAPVRTPRCECGPGGVVCSCID